MILTARNCTIRVFPLSELAAPPPTNTVRTFVYTVAEHVVCQKMSRWQGQVCVALAIFNVQMTAHIFLRFKKICKF